MTDKLIATDGTSSGLSAGAAISDTDYLEVQQTVVSPASTVNSQFSSIWTWILSKISANASTVRTDLAMGTFYGGPPAATGIANVYNTTPTAQQTLSALTTLRLYMTPVYWPGGTATGLAFTVSTAAAAGKVVRLGIYNIKSDGTPGTLIIEPTSGAPIAVDTTGTKTVAFSQAMNAGWYFLALISDGNPTVSASTDSSGSLGLALSGTAVGIPVTYVFRLLGALAALGDETGNSYTASGSASTRPTVGIK